MFAYIMRIVSFTLLLQLYRESQMWILQKKFET